MENHPRLSVIIPTLEEEHFLPLLLADLRTQTYQPYEIIVVDGGSRDRTRELAAPFAQVLEHVPGVGGQRQRGGEEARGDILVFLDADVRLAPDTLWQLISSFGEKGCKVACPRYWPASSTVSIRLIFIFFDVLFWLLQKVVPSGAGPCILVTRERFRQSGGFRTDTAYDDIAFIRRAARLGSFSILPVVVQVSDRRFRREGTAWVFCKYVALSPFFCLGWFRAANIIRYKFAHYQSSSAQSEKVAIQ